MENGFAPFQKYTFSNPGISVIWCIVGMLCFESLIVRLSVLCVVVQTGKALAVGIESLTLEGGGSVEDVDLDFTLPGCSDIELKVRCPGCL